jgi:8-oxo-dGTP diphosphatase
LIEATLVLLFKGDPISEVLLGLKKTGFGRGKVTGFGGKVEPGEACAQAASRELAEETGIIRPAESLTYIAILEFHFPHRLSWSQRVHVFTAYLGDDTSSESREMMPRWFPIEAIPYDQMWDDGRYWLPRILAGRKFQARFTFKPDNATVDTVEFKPF